MKLWVAVIAIDLTICTGILVYEAYKAITEKPVAVFNLTPEGKPMNWNIVCDGGAK